MSNGLIDPVFQILPNKIDAIRRSGDPLGNLGAMSVTRGHLTVTGKTARLARTLPLARGHLTLSAKAMTFVKQRAIQRGHLTMHGRSIQLGNANWAVIPDFNIDRSQTFPAFVPNIRVNWLIDPGANVPPGNIVLQNINLAGLSYDAGNDRIVVSTNPGVDSTDVLSLQAITNTSSVVVSNDFTLYVRSLAGFPAAGVIQLDATGAATSVYAPSADPDGVFFGMTSTLAQNDKWWVENVPAGATVTPLPGGSYTIAVASNMTTGLYNFTVARWVDATKAIIRTTQPFVAATSLIYVDAANPSAGTGTLGNPFNTIQAAHDAATSGAVITVATGTYPEAVTITKSNITLVAPGASVATRTFPVTINGGQTRNNGIFINGAVSNVLIDGFRVTLTRTAGIYMQGPGLNTIEVRNCSVYDVGNSGVACWGVQFGVDPVPTNWRGAQNIRIHDNLIQKACNSFWGAGGFNEQITVANGVFNLYVYNNTIDSPIAADYTLTTGGEGIDLKEGVENGNVYNNWVLAPKNSIYLDAGKSSTSAGGYTRPGFLKNIHVYNNVVYNSAGHGITITAEADFATSATGVNGRKGGQINDIFIDYNTVYSSFNAGILVFDRGLLIPANNTGFDATTVPLCDNVQVVNNVSHANATGGNGAYSGINHDHQWATGSIVKKNVVTGTFSGIHVTRGTPAVTGTINSDPLFGNAAALDFSLQTGSPAKNTGGDAFVNPTTDFSGNPRPFGVASDIGAYERQQT